MSRHTGPIAVVGARGAVGQEALKILESLKVPAHRVQAFGSARSQGSGVCFAGETLPVTELTSESLTQSRVALFCADAATAKTFAPGAVANGVTVIDNSSAFRMDPEVPLVIPEVNGHLLDKLEGAALIANPNCSTIILLTALHEIRKTLGIRDVVVSTYQAVSGAGLAGLNELMEQTRAYLDGRELAPEVFPESCALNLFPHESALDESTGRNGEEDKIILETRKIWDTTEIEIVPTCVRVPVERAHSQSICVTLNHSTSREAAESILAAAPGVELWPHTREGFPTPRRAAGKDLVHVGRVRVSGDGRRLLLWVCGDQIRKGAALNAIQIAQRLGLLSGSVADG